MIRSTADWQEHEKSNRYSARVLGIRRITPDSSSEDVREIELEVEDLGFDIKVGQNFGVLAPTRGGDHNHHRLYSVADVPRRTATGRQRFCICVRRCYYRNELTGEEFPGVASNYLCDLKPGDSLPITGPYGKPFTVPREKYPNIVMICVGTGIAPFRGFVQQIYEERPDFTGRIWLFHGSESGLDRLYRNDQADDFSLYYDRATFEAFNAIGTLASGHNWGDSMHTRGKELCRMLSNPNTYVYVSGLESIRDELDDVLAEVAGSNERWYRWKASLEAEQRWIELLY